MVMKLTTAQMPNDQFMELWEAGIGYQAIGKVLGVSKRTIQRRVIELGLSVRERRDKGVPRNQPKSVVAAPPVEVVQHKAAVRMPSEALQDRADWPDLQAAVERAKRGPAPMASLGMVAARFRLPTAVVQGLAARVAA